MATFKEHLEFDRLFVGQELPELHREVDKGWGDGNIMAHMAAHTPIYGLFVVLPKYGPRGLVSHFWHCMVDSPLSPWQWKDIAGHLAKFGRGG